MIDAYLIEPAPVWQPELAPEPAPVLYPGDQDPDLFALYDWLERAMAEHFGIPFDLCRDALAELDRQVEARWGVIYFETHMMSPDLLQVIGQGLVEHLQETRNLDFSAAGPFPVTLH
jgi:hypothetical protein